MSPSPSSHGCRSMFGELRDLSSSAPSSPKQGEGLATADVIGRYSILGKLGAGGMGIVFAAYDPELQRKIALKLLASLPEGCSSTEGQRRLLREAQALAKLAHPNVVAVHDVGTHENRVWIAMEYVAGQTLRDWARQRPRKWSEITRVLTDAARGVAAAHDAKMVHGDLKPDNVMIDGDARVRVLDFGLVRVLNSAPSTTPLELESTAPSGRLVKRRTHSSTRDAYGTPAYMAPEVWQGQDAGPATDQFAWSVMAWELLYGERPFIATSKKELGARVMSGQRSPPPRGCGVPTWLRRVIERGLATDPTRRWPSMAMLLMELERDRTQVRRRMAAVALAGLAVLGGGVEGWRRWGIAQRVAACETMGSDIDVTWNDDARKRLNDAFQATGVNYAVTTAKKVMPWLDRQAAAWKEARTEACLNADVRSLWSYDVLDRAVWCLSERQMEMESLVAQFGRANNTVVQNAVTAVASLKSVEACMDDGALRRQPVPPVQARPALLKARATLIQADSLELAGNLTDAIKVATAARAQAWDWPPLWAAARAKESFLLASRGAFKEATAAGTEAYFIAGRSGAWEVAARAATDLVFTVGRREAQPTEGHFWGRLAELAIAHVDDHTGLWEADRLSHIAVVHRAEGAYREARELNERVLAILEKNLPPEHPEFAGTLNNLALVHQDTAAYAEAQVLLERALSILEKAFGPEHPEIATILENLANVHYLAGAYANALTFHERALAIKEKAFGPDHPDVALVLSNLAVAYEAAGVYPKARALNERALAIYEKVGGPDHPDVATTLHNLANVHEASRDFTGARVLLERALAILEKARGADHLEVARCLNDLAIVHQATGAHSTARPLFERALDIKENALGPDHSEVAVTLHGLANLHSEAKEFAKARHLLERALAIWEKALSPNHTYIAASLTSLAVVHYHTADLAKARALFERALAINERTLGPDDPEVAVNLNNVAQVYLDEGKPQNALRLLERAVAIFDTHEGVQSGESEARFGLAKAIVATNGDHTQAILEARKACDEYRASGASGTTELADVEKWVAKQAGKASKAARPRRQPSK